MKLSDLHSLIRFIDKYKSYDKLPLDLTTLAKEDTKLGDFYRSVKSTKITSDEKVAFSLYGEDQPGTKYKFLKSHFTSRLLNNMTALDLSNDKISEHTQAVYKAYKYMFFSTVLLRLGNVKIALTVARKGLGIAEKYELHLIAIEMLSHLRSQYLQEGHYKMFNLYSKRLEQKIRLLENELKIKEIEGKARSRFAKNLFVDEKYRSEAISAAKKIGILVNKHSTFLGRISHFRMLYISRQISGDPRGSIAACDAAIVYMKAHPHLTPKRGIGEFLLYKLENYLWLRDFDKAKEMVVSSLQYFPEGSWNWFKYKEYEFLFEMHLLNFKNASAIYREVIHHENFEQVVIEHLKERWKIFGLYIQFVAQRTGDQKKKQPIEFPKVSSYSRDKQGFHVAVVLLNILHLLETKNFIELNKQLEILSSYRFKYLSGRYSRQSYLLFRLLEVMKTNSYNQSSMYKKTRMYEGKLSRSAPSVAEILECVQILPVDWIWQVIKEALHGSNVKSQ
jgi:hypothetical protein